MLKNIFCDIRGCTQIVATFDPHKPWGDAIVIYNYHTSKVMLVCVSCAEKLGMIISKKEK